MAIGERLREERKKLNLTQAVFAQLGGIGVSALKMYEGNEREPGALFLAAISHEGADVQYIVTGNPSSTAITPDEQVLLDGYRALDPATRRRMLAFMLGGSDPAPGQTQKSKTVNVTSQSAGRDIKN